MREIRFRVWQPSIKTMVQIESFDCVRQPPFWYQACLNFQEGAPVTTNAINRKDEPDFILMQYTGLKDKNGVEIYEGDIVNLVDIDDGDTGNYTVSWEKSGYFTLKPFIDADGYVPTLGHFTDKDSNDGYYTIEIIGNIYENPELLEEK